MRALIVTVLLFAVWPLQAAVTNCDDATGMAGRMPVKRSTC